MSQDFQLAGSQNGGGKRTLVVEILFQHTTDLRRQKVAGKFYTSWIPTLHETNIISIYQEATPKGNQSSNHPFSGAKILVSGFGITCWVPDGLGRCLSVGKASRGLKTMLDTLAMSNPSGRPTTCLQTSAPRSKDPSLLCNILDVESWVVLPGVFAAAILLSFVSQAQLMGGTDPGQGTVQQRQQLISRQVSILEAESELRIRSDFHVTCESYVILDSCFGRKLQISWQ